MKKGQKLEIIGKHLNEHIYLTTALKGCGGGWHSHSLANRIEIFKLLL